MNFIFGCIVGCFITLFCMQPEHLGNALHWAGDQMAGREQIDILDSAGNSGDQ